MFNLKIYKNNELINETFQNWENVATHFKNCLLKYQNEKCINIDDVKGIYTFKLKDGIIYQYEKVIK